MFEYKLKDLNNTILKFETGENVFYPTGTSTLVVKACRSYINAPGKTLELGCGCGFIGLTLAKLGLCNQPLYASDISGKAIELTKKNAQQLDIKVIAKCGSLFEPWKGEKFDLIINEVSGVAEKVAKLSPWFNGVACEAGRDGADWHIKVFEEAPLYLNRGGKIILAIVTLSNETKILAAAKKHFSQIKLLEERIWSMPDEMAEKIDQIMPLIEDGTISCNKKWGKWTWATKVYSFLE